MPSLAGALIRLSAIATLALLLLASGGIATILFVDARGILHGRADYLRDLLAETLAIPLWQTTDYVVEAIGAAATRSEDVAFLEIKDESGRIIYSWTTDRGSTFGIERRDFTVSYNDMPIGSGTIAVTDAGVMPRAVRVAGLTALLVGLSSALNLFLLRSGIHRSFGSALERLGAAAGEYARGDYGRDIRDVGGYREFRALAETMAAMVGTIRSQMEDLRRFSEGLEGKVAARTAELQERNRELDRERERAEGLVAELTEASRAKDEFLATMSHELRTPLNAIIGFARLIHGDPAIPGETRRQVAIIRDAGSHLLAIINDVLDTAKVAARKLELQPAPFDLQALPGFIRSLIAPRAAEKDLILEVAVEDALPAAVVGDERRVRQVILNLANNAVKYTPRGRVDIHFSWDPATSLLAVSVRDTGSGIARERLASLFRPFERIRSKGEFIEGTGLGLTISKGLAECMGGGIEVESEEGAGSVFTATMRLPAAAGPAGSLVQESEVTGYEGPRRRVLVVDDVPDNVALLVAILEPLGFSCVTAADGRDALGLLPGGFDLLLTDYRMPRMDGDELIAAMRDLPGGAAIPAIGLSASFSDGDASFTKVCDRFLRKPIDTGNLLRAVGELLGLAWTRAVPGAAARDGGAAPDRGRPDGKTLAELGEAALRGDYARIESLVAELEDSGHLAFARELRGLADRYDEAGIRALAGRGD